jgi:hypothetical protein
MTRSRTEGAHHGVRHRSGVGHGPAASTMSALTRRMFDPVEPIGPSRTQLANQTSRCSPWGSPTSGTPTSPAGLPRSAALCPRLSSTRSSTASPRVRWPATSRRSGARLHPEAAIAARQDGRVNALRRILGDLIDTRDVELLIKAATSAPSEGRPEVSTIPRCAALAVTALPRSLLASYFSGGAPR